MPHIDFLILFMSCYRLIVCKSLFSMMVKPSMVKPFGLSSDRDAFSRRQVVTRLRSVTLLCRMIFLCGVGHGTVGIGVEVAHHAVHLQHLVDVPGR